MIQAFTDSAASVTFSGFGIAPSSYAFLLWAPLLAIFAALALWLVALLVLQRRRRLRSTGPSRVAWTRYRIGSPQTQA